MSPELDTYGITKRVKEVLTDNNLGRSPVSGQVISCLWPWVKAKAEPAKGSEWLQTTYKNPVQSRCRDSHL
jgi:hypothetical protein